MACVARVLTRDSYLEALEDRGMGEMNNRMRKLLG